MARKSKSNSNGKANGVEHTEPCASVPQAAPVAAAVDSATGIVKVAPKPKKLATPDQVEPPVKEEPLPPLKTYKLDDLKYNRDLLVRVLMAIALFDARHMYDDAGINPRTLRQLDEVTVLSVAGLKVNEIWQHNGERKVLMGHAKEYKMADRLRAIELLLKVHGDIQMSAQDKFDILGILNNAIATAKLVSKPRKRDPLDESVAVEVKEVKK